MSKKATSTKKRSIAAEKAMTDGVPPEKKLMRGGVDPLVGKATQIKPGEVRNPGGRPKRKPFTDALLQVLTERPTEARDAVQGLLDAAKKGDSNAFKALADRAEGKVLQGIRMEGELGLSTPEERKRRVVDFLRKAADRIEGPPTDQVQ